MCRGNQHILLVKHFHAVFCLESGQSFEANGVVHHSHVCRDICHGIVGGLGLDHKGAGELASVNPGGMSDWVDVAILGDKKIGLTTYVDV